MKLLRRQPKLRDPRLDRLIEFDERSRNYPVRELIRGRTAPTRGRSWRCDPRLDQGQEGACVGFAWAHELAAIPVVVRNISDQTARTIYHAAQRIDEWPGENYSGTSVLAGAKVCHTLGLVSEYRWAFGIADVVDTLARFGPVVLGIPWLESMYRPNAQGLLDCSSATIVGGHAILARGVLLKGITGAREPVIRLRNSWGQDWGLGGDCFVRASDLERLLHMGGEACVPVARARGDLQ